MCECVLYVMYLLYSYTVPPICSLTLHSLTHLSLTPPLTPQVIALKRKEVGTLQNKLQGGLNKISYAAAEVSATHTHTHKP